MNPLCLSMPSPLPKTADLEAVATIFVQQSGIKQTKAEFLCGGCGERVLGWAFIVGMLISN